MSMILSLALEIAQKIENDRAKVLALARIAEKYLEVGQTEIAGQIFIQALQLVHPMKADNKPSQKNSEQALGDRLLNLFEVSYFQAEKYDSALQIVQSIEDENLKVRALEAIASHATTVPTIDTALRIAQTIENDCCKALALASVALGYAKTGQAGVAADLFAQVLTMTQTIENDPDKDWALFHTAYKYVFAEQYDSAFQIAQLIESDRYKDPVLISIARDYATAGQFDRAMQIAQLIENEESKTRALAQIALVLARAGQSDQALKIAHTIDDEWVWVDVICS